MYRLPEIQSSGKSAEHSGVCQRLLSLLVLQTHFARDFTVLKNESWWLLVPLDTAKIVVHKNVFKHGDIPIAIGTVSP